MDKKKIAFIGLGAMGKSMAGHLAGAGYPLTVYDLNPAPVEALKNQGAAVAASCAAASREADVVITMLPADEEVKQAILGENGVLEGARPGTVIIDMTSMAPHTAIHVAGETAKKGVHYLDAPVSGGTVGAEKAILTIMVGGDAELLEKHRDILETMGRTIFHVGGVGMGETVKMINQILVGVNILGIAEAFTLGVKLGVDPQKLYDIIKVSAGYSFMLDNRVPDFIFKGDFTQPGFAVDLLRKDVGLAMETGKLQKMPLPLSAQVYQWLTFASAAGKGKLDQSSVIEIFEELAGVKVRTPQK